MSITLAPEIEARLNEKAARQGAHLETLVNAMLADALAWEAQERAEAIAGIQRGLDDVAAGRERPLSEFLAEQRQKHGFAENWPDE